MTGWWLAAELVALGAAVFAFLVVAWGVWQSRG